MKKIICCLCLLCANVVSAQAQIVGPSIVNDPINRTVLERMIVQTETQIKVVNEQLSFAKKAYNRVEKVNQTIQQLRMVEDLVDRGVQVVDQINRIYDRIGSIEGFTPTYLARCGRQCTLATQQVIGNLNFISSVLLGKFKMTDSERISSLQENLNAINMTAASIERLDQQTSRLASKMNLITHF